MPFASALPKVSVEALIRLFAMNTFLLNSFDVISCWHSSEDDRVYTLFYHGQSLELLSAPVLEDAETLDCTGAPGASQESDTAKFIEAAIAVGCDEVFSVLTYLRPFRQQLSMLLPEPVDSEVVALESAPGTR